FLFYVMLEKYSIYKIGAFYLGEKGSSQKKIRRLITATSVGFLLGGVVLLMPVPQVANAWQYTHFYRLRQNQHAR
ncbi:MAG: hypothetical protein Q9P01_19050, partial [Anaerolineae bacterium]|nr:hypothetical protein [Anaerolineae bacterium]